MPSTRAAIMWSVCTALLLLVSMSAAETLVPTPKCDLIKVNCVVIDPQKCIDERLAYVPADGVTQCCDECQKVDDFMDTSACDPSLCPRVRCRPQSFKECFINQILMPSDGLCLCCPACVYRKGSWKCGPKNCAKVSCNDATPEECISKKLAFVPRDYDCNCCDSCQEINDVTEPIVCIPELCTTAKFAPQTIKDCNGRQVLVPAGGCYCSDTCVNKKLN